MKFALHAVVVFTVMAAASGLVTARDPYRCTDETGLVLLTSDAGADRVCKMLSRSNQSATDGGKCSGKHCSIRITRDEEGHFYINGSSNGTVVRYPVDVTASAMAICIRGKCKATQDGQ